MQIIKRRKIWFSVSGIFVVASILALLVWGLNLGIDFSGGTLAEFQFSEIRPDNNEIKDALQDMNLEDLSVASLADKNVILRFKNIREGNHAEITNTLKEKFEGIEELSFEEVGPTIGKELQRKSINALIIVIIAIVLYVAWAFRKVSKPVASWKYGVAAIIALIHDVLIVAGIFAILGKFYGVEVGVPFIAALLTILGYSVNDSIVVFDRARENLFKGGNETYEEVINRSINETIPRSLNTSITTFLALCAVYIFGGESIKYFMLALMIGAVVGTYSSIFIASPLVVAWERWRDKGVNLL